MLIREEMHDDLITKAADIQYLQSLSDDELLKLHRHADDLRFFFMLMQSVTKELCNSVYGGFGTPSLRFFNAAVAADITGEGRWACQLMEKVGQNYFKLLWPNDHEWHKELKEKFPTIMINEPQAIHKSIVVTADTDSNYLTFDYVFESLGHDARKIDPQLATEFVLYFMQKKMNPLYDKVLTQSIAARNGKSTMIFELETIGGFGIFVAKKKYVFEKLWHDGKFVIGTKSLKTTGIELAQKSTPIVARNAIKTFINVIFAKRGDISSSMFFSMCKALKDKLRDVKPEELAKNTSLNKYKEYVIDDKETIKLKPKCPYVVRGAARYNQLIWKNQLQAKYSYLKNGMRAKVYYDLEGQPFSFPNDSDFPHEIAPKMNLDMQLEKLIFAPVKRLVSGGMIDGDLTRMGQDKVQKGFNSMFKK